MIIHRTATEHPTRATGPYAACDRSGRRPRDRRFATLATLATVAPIAAIAGLIALSVAVFAAPLAAQEDVAATAPGPRSLMAVTPGPRINNGLPTSSYPSVVALLDDSFGGSFCSGTLVGCSTVVTAAHCVCGGDGVDCQEGGPLLDDPGNIVVFLQHAGAFAVESIAVPEGYEFGIREDVAVLKLAGYVEGVAPTPVNTDRDPTKSKVSEVGTIVGFGLTQGDALDSGIKRFGDVVTSPCFLAVPDDGNHICWQYTDPVGPAGEDSNTCAGDSGGPLFLDFGEGDRLAGITSGGRANDCEPFDEAFDTNVWAVRKWIAEQAGSDLKATSCGGLPDAGEDPEAEIWSGEGTLGNDSEQEELTFEVPEDAVLLRVSLNGEDGPTFQPTDMDLYLRQGTPATRIDYDCASQRSGPFEICEIPAPVPGTWHLLAHLFDGPGGDFQVTATIFRSGESQASCTPTRTTLCISDVPGDRRFRVRIRYFSAGQGGIEGSGEAISLAPLGVRRGGLFWFFSRDNPEVLLKVLNGCGINGYYWIFWSAGTNLGLEVEVVDTQTGKTRLYTNADGVTAPPVADVFGFSCN